MHMRARGTNGHRCCGYFACLSVLAALALTSDAEAGTGRGRSASRSAWHDIVNAELGLEASRVVRLDLDARPGAPMSVALPARAAPRLLGRLGYMDLEPFSVRSEDYRVLMEQADGSLEEIKPGPVRTLRGAIRGMPGSLVAGTLRPDGLEARIRFPNHEELWLQPVGALVPEMKAGQHVAYRSADIIETEEHCDVRADGTPDRQIPDRVAGGLVGHGAGQSPEGYALAELAIDVDYEYFRRYGSVAAVEERINSIVNAINVQFERDVKVRHLISAIIVRTEEPDPYTATDAIALAREFREQWLSRHGDVRRDLAQLLTGKDLDGDIVGWAWLAGAGGPSAGYSVVQSDWTGNFAAVTDLSAHELGHNWSAEHCNCASPAYTMNARITGANRFSPQATIPAIEAFRDSHIGRDVNAGSAPPPEQPATFAATASPAGRIRLTRFHGDGSGDGIRPERRLKGPEEPEEPDPFPLQTYNIFRATTRRSLAQAWWDAGEAGYVCILYHIHIDPEVTGTVDQDLLRQSVQEMIPEDTSMAVCLDMEGPYTRGLAAEIGSDEWNHTIEQMALAADIVKEERPNVKLSYWGVPLSIWCWGWEDGQRRSWYECRPETRQKVIDRWVAARPLIERIDWFTPCAYDYYPVAHAPEEDAIARDGIEFTAMVCDAMLPGAPIVFSVSPRCYRTGVDWYLQLLPTDEIYADQVRPSLKYGNGIIWWGADEYYYGKGLIPADEIDPGQPWQAVWDSYFKALHGQQHAVFRQMADALVNP